MNRLFAKLERCSRWLLTMAALVILVLIGIIDYLSGYELLFSAFYLLEVGLAAWFIGRRFGLLMSCLSVMAWIGGDLAAGARYSNPFIPVWNALILLVVYVTVVGLLTALRSLHRGLEAKVHQRTKALEQEIAERQRLEEEILQISEREQRRIGHDLHDGLCQHLTATALAGQVLTGRLESKALPEAVQASKVVGMLETGIDMARNLARGLYPVEMNAEGLMDAFQELAEMVSQSTNVRCAFECEAPVLISDSATATHLYRIAQEAVRNALRHAKPERIGISLTERNGQITLTVEDDGLGLPEAGPVGPGLGVRIMEHRAATIGGQFTIEPAPAGGTMMTCSFSKAPAPRLTLNEQPQS